MFRVKSQKKRKEKKRNWIGLNANNNVVVLSATCLSSAMFNHLFIFYLFVFLLTIIEI